MAKIKMGKIKMGKQRKSKFFRKKQATTLTLLVVATCLISTQTQRKIHVIFYPLQWCLDKKNRRRNVAMFLMDSKTAFM